MDPRPFGCEPESRPCGRTTLEATHRYVGLLRIESCPRRNGTTGGPFLFRIPRGKTRVFWRRPVRLEVFGPDGVHEHLERWTFAPSGMNRSRPYGRKLSRPPPPPRRAVADGKGPRALSHLRGGHAAMHQLHSDGHLREAPDITDVSAEKSDARQVSIWRLVRNRLRP